MQTTADLREGFLSFFESKGHTRWPSAPVIPPADDLSTLFIVAGMQPLKRYFLAVEAPPAPLLATAQKVMRAGGKHNDLDDVGRTPRHASFFEMLGNFSFGQYFKDGAIDLAWEFVTEHLRFPVDRLWATVFAGDPELGLGEDQVAIDGWLRVGIPRERIVGLPRSENFWQAAETGPCGPCSELNYDRGEEYGCGRPECAPGCECDRYLEFWNLVFMEYDLSADGVLTPLPEQNIDTGLGLERGAMLLQGVESIFDTDGYQHIMNWVAEKSGVRYGDSEQATKAHRVLADHGRAMTFLLADGIAPGNEGRAYVLRRIIRRAIVHGLDLGLEGFLPDLAERVIEQMEAAYPELAERRTVIRQLLEAEEGRFSRTLRFGERLFLAAAEAGAVSADDAFRLHDTHGYPIELIRERAAERGIPVDEDGYRELMAQQRARSRQASSFDVAGRLVGEARSEFVGYEKTEVLTALAAVEPVGDGTFQAKLHESPFYPEGGGQVSDAGYLEHEATGVRAELVRATRLGDDQVLTFRGDGFAAGDRVRAVVLWSARYPTQANHTATHLLHRALRHVLGEHVHQAGSAVRPDKLRFDFSHPQALTQAQRDEVERRVNEWIFQNLPVLTYVVPIEEARTLGATMLFGEKYGDEVRVVEVPGTSMELCGGTHVRTTAEIGPFVILSEGSVGAGNRRIEAVTSGEAFAYLESRAREVDELRHELEKLRRQAKAKPDQRAPEPELAVAVQAVDGVNVVVQAAGDLAAEALLDLSDRLKQQHAPAAIVLGSAVDGSVSLVANFDEAVASRISAVDVIRGAAALVGGGGGGRPTMARAGGKQPDRLPDALAEAQRLIVAGLAG